MKTERRGRKRKHNPTIPAHIDQAAIPAGLYWDASGTGRWYVVDTDPETGRRKTKAVASSAAKLSDLHAIMEQRAGSDARGTLGRMMTEFQQSTEFAALVDGTRKDYRYCEGLVRAQRTKVGTMDTLQADAIEPPVIRRLVELIAQGRPESKPGAGDDVKPRPTAANHVLRYLRRLYAWGIAFGLATKNPARGVKATKERGQFKMPTPEAYAATLAFARERGARKAHSAGSCPAYLAPVMELAYLCCLRGSEVIDLTDANETRRGVVARRRKGSQDNVLRWNKRLRRAWLAAAAIRPADPDAGVRQLLFGQNGPLTKGALDQAWQDFMALAIREGAITAADYFTLHGLKHRGLTDAKDDRTAGHKSEAMRRRYRHKLETFDPAAR